MNRIFRVFLGCAALLAALPATAALQVLACEPEWGALVRALGGADVSVREATTARQDVHRVQARPSLIAAARRADLLVCSGAELEIGWLPVLLRQAGNPRILPGAPGYFEAAAVVNMLEVPTRVDRADGDVHPDGNPHIQTDPHNILKVADALAVRLAEIDPPNATGYAARHADFARRWRVAMAGWETRARPLAGMGVVVQHKAFAYLQHWLGLREIGAIEPKPGIEPSSASLAALLAGLATDPPRAILRAAYDDGRGSEWLAGKLGIPVVVLPFTVGGSERATDLFGLFDDTVDRLLAVAR